MKFIHFFSKPEYQGLGEPEPVKKFIPEWYRKSETTFKDKNTGEDVSGVKRCVPFLDAMMSGYVLTLPMDVFVSENKDGTLNLRWNSEDTFRDFISERPHESGALIPRPAGHHDNHVAWRGVWGFRTPRGWSVMVVHPLNRWDLPFTTTSGIIDSDKYSTSGNIPFFVKKGFTGVIPKGTPIAQLIPVKRAKWTKVINKGFTFLEDIQGGIVRSPGHSYKKDFWIRKTYE